MKIGIITEGMKVAKWQADALETLPGDTEFVIYNCLNSAPGKRQLRHAAYYLLNLLTIKNPLTRSVPIPSTLKIVAKVHFEAAREGSWQSLPLPLLETIGRDQPVVIVKFGMGLLIVPPSERLPVPILSYHHGDPSRFRGRPAGFYELLAGERTVGQIIQLLSNRLDSGRIVAAAETRALAHSYKQTLIEAYRHSRLLLPTAVHNAIAKASWTPPHWGPAYRLPSSRQVLQLVRILVRNRLSRIVYGLTREKRWNVATAPLAQPVTLGSLCASLEQEARWTPAPMPPRCRFVADPFFHPSQGLLVEAMMTDTKRGAIFHMHDRRFQRISGRGGHFSYPSVIRSKGHDYVVPEVSDWSVALAFPLDEEGLGEPFKLRLPGMPRLVDPTPFIRKNQLYLFANRADEGPSVLRLWVASSIDADFTEHPSSPIRISPRGGRMGGTLLEIPERLIRVGQDLRGDYGDGISFFEVTRLDSQNYAEVDAGGFRFEHWHGPHTINVAREELAFDYYLDRFSPLAGIRRILERRAAGRMQG